MWGSLSFLLSFHLFFFPIVFLYSLLTVSFLLPLSSFFLALPLYFITYCFLFFPFASFTASKTISISKFNGLLQINSLVVFYRLKTTIINFLKPLRKYQPQENPCLIKSLPQKVKHSTNNNNHQTSQQKLITIEHNL